MNALIVRVLNEDGREVRELIKMWYYNSNDKQDMDSAYIGAMKYIMKIRKQTAKYIFVMKDLGEDDE